MPLRSAPSQSSFKPFTSSLCPTGITAVLVGNSSSAVTMMQSAPDWLAQKVSAGFYAARERRIFRQGQVRARPDQTLGMATLPRRTRRRRAIPNPFSTKRPFGSQRKPTGACHARRSRSTLQKRNGREPITSGERATALPRTRLNRRVRAHGAWHRDTLAAWSSLRQRLALWNGLGISRGAKAHTFAKRRSDAWSFGETGFSQPLGQALIVAGWDGLDMLKVIETMAGVNNRIAKP
jgi:hypothetical protein